MFCLLALATWFAAWPAERALTVEGIERLRQHFQLEQFDAVTPETTVRLAVIDTGFGGVDLANTDRIYLPPNTELINFSAEPDTASDGHGLQMAHLVWAMTGYRSTGLELKLYRIDSPSSFAMAAHHLIKDFRAHIVLFSNVWHKYGNFDGIGPVSGWVREATSRQIIWINAAGNNGGLVFDGPVESVALPNHPNTTFVKLPHQTIFARFKNLADDYPVTVTAAWTGYKPGLEASGTDQDLDLTVMHPDHTRCDRQTDARCLQWSGESTQVLRDPGPGETLHPFETVVIPHMKSLGEREYLIAVTVKSGRFDPRRDRLRITLSTQAPEFYDETQGRTRQPIEFTDATHTNELGVPADGAGITVGDLSANSAQGLSGKPELLLEIRQADFSNFEGALGNSYSAAIFAGIAATLKRIEPRLSSQDLLRLRGAFPYGYLRQQGWSFLDSDRMRLPRSIRTMLDAAVVPYAVDSATGSMQIGVDSFDCLPQHLLAHRNTASDRVVLFTAGNSPSEQAGWHGGVDPSRPPIASDPWHYEWRLRRTLAGAPLPHWTHDPFGRAALRQTFNSWVDTWVLEPVATGDAFELIQFQYPRNPQPRFWETPSVERINQIVTERTR